MDFSQWYEEQYHELSGAGLWLRGAEWNGPEINDYDQRSFRVLLIRLSTYRDTCSSFTHTLLYQLISGLEDTFCDFAFLPPPRDAKLFSSSEIPWILGTTTKKGPDGFDVIALSNSIAQELINLPGMLQNSGISLSKRERLSSASTPLVILGGANALHLPVLFTNDPMVDGIFIGEDSALIGQLFTIIRQCKSAGLGKEKILLELETVDGFIQPDKPRHTRKYSTVLKDLSSIKAKRPVMFSDDFAGSAHIAISEGCACFCSFCAESWARKPYRELNANTALADALRLKSEMGLESIDIYSFNFNMHSELYQLLWALSEKVSSIGLKSQRFDFISRDPELLRVLHVLGKSSLTCGLEGISPRLRAFLQKGLKEDELAASLRRLIKAPIRELKIFLIATGLEEQCDYDAFRDFLRTLSSTMEACGRRPRIIFSMTPLVRFPHTPLEFDDAPEEAVFRTVMQQTARIVRSRNFEFRESAGAQESWLSQLLVRSCDERVMQALVQSVKETGFIYTDGVTEEFAAVFRGKLDQLGLDLKAEAKGKNRDDVYPWNMVDTGVSREFLHDVYLDCLAGVDKGYCLGTAESEGDCRGCGSCTDARVKERITSIRSEVKFSADDLKTRLQKTNAQQSALHFHVETDFSRRGIPARYFASVLASAIMTMDSAFSQLYSKFGSSWRSANLGDFWIDGHDVLTLYWHKGESLFEAIRDRIPELNYRLSSWMNVMSIHLAMPSIEKSKVLIDSPFDIDTSSFFSSYKLKATIRRAKEQYLCDFSTDSLKRKVLTGMTFSRKAEGGSFAELAIGPKYDHLNSLSLLFSVPSPSYLYRIGRRLEFDCKSSTEME